MKYLVFTFVVGASLVYLATGDGQTRKTLEDIEIPAELNAVIEDALAEKTRVGAERPPMADPSAAPENVVVTHENTEMAPEESSRPDAEAEPKEESDEIVVAQVDEDAVFTPPTKIDSPVPGSTAGKKVKTAVTPVTEQPLPLPEEATPVPAATPDVAARRTEVLDFDAEEVPEIATESTVDRRARLLDLSDEMALFAAEAIAR